MTHSIENFVHRKVVVLHMDAPIREAGTAMCRRDIGCVVVIDRKHHLVGIVTDRDVACALASTGRHLDEPISEIMTPDPVVVEESASFDDAVRAMEDAGVRRVPVVRTGSDGKKCVGLIALDDLVAGGWIDPTSLARVVRAQIRARVAPYWRPAHSEKAQARAEERADHTVNRFYKRIAERTDLPPALLAPITQFLLGSLVRRLHYSGAAHLIAQLPQGLQEDLLDLPSGPDREITVATMVDGLRTRYGMSDPAAKRALTEFYSALGELLSGEIEHVKAQLPEGMRVLFRSHSDFTHLAS